MRLQSPVLAAAIFAALSPNAAQATNGYFSHGYGVRSQGQAGVGIAWAQDGLAAATNPAGTVLVGNRVDLGLTWFAPRRGGSISGNAFGADSDHDGDGTKNFFVPGFAVTRRWSDTLAGGLAIYGNGGLQTEYRDNPYARFGGTGFAGVSLEQLFFTPSIAWKPTPAHSLGVALNIAYQRFSAQGVGVFGAFSSAPGQVSDRGTDSSLGVGVRVGWIGELSPGLSLGAAWASKMRGSFEEYRGLFADGGRFDVPENYGVGVKFQPMPAWTFGADLQTIRYSRVGAVGNPLASLLQGSPLGAANGPGFGWRDVTALKLAVAYQVSSELQLRAGFSHARQPVPASETFLNLLAPGVVGNHYTVGASWSRPGGGEWSVFLAHAPTRSVRGSGSIPAGNPPGGFGGGEADVRLRETMLGVAYSWAR